MDWENRYQHAVAEKEHAESVAEAVESLYALLAEAAKLEDSVTGVVSVEVEQVATDRGFLREAMGVAQIVRLCQGDSEANARDVATACGAAACRRPRRATPATATRCACGAMPSLRAR